MKRHSGPVRIGLAGMGRIARAHLEAIAALPVEHVRLVAVASRKPAAELGLAAGVRVHGEYAQLLADSEVDAVLICYPNAMHRATVLAALAAGKHVLVEKPIGMTEAEVAEMVAAARTSRLTLMSAQSRRFSDAIEAARRALPEIGRLYRIVINFLVPFAAPPTPWWTDPDEAGELIVHLQGSHSVDTVVWLANAEPQWVAARTARLNPAFGGADEADMLLGFADGMTAAVHLSLNTKPYHHEMIVVGSEGSMHLVERPSGVPFGVSYSLQVNGTPRVEGVQSPTIYTKQLVEFITALREGREPLASGAEVLRTTRVLDAVVAAARSGNTVRL